MLIVDLVDHHGQDCDRPDEALTSETVQAGIEKLLAAQKPLLKSMESVHDLVRWRNEVVRLARTRDYAICSLADLLVDGEENGRMAVQAGITAWEALLAAAIRRARDNRELAPDTDPGRLATGLLAALQGGLLLARTTRDVRQLETALDMALGYVQAHALTERGTT